MSWDTAQNAFIEGDNLEVLKLLQKAYNDQIKMIYIDPPYNTGKDFVYSDNFQDSLQRYLEYTGQLDLYGNRYAAAIDKAGRRHSRWASMMYPRLMLARNLLTQDGLIFISIDDNEAPQLRLMLDEIFGGENFVETYIWESTFRPDNSSKIERENAQYVHCYARNKSSIGRLVGAQRKSEGLPSLTMSKMPVVTIELQPSWVDFGFDRGDFEPGDMGGGYTLEDPVRVRGGRAERAFRLSGRVKWSQSYIEEQVAAGTRIVIKGSKFVPYSKKLETAPLPPTSLIPRDEVGDILAANAEIRGLFGSVPFDFPKPTSLLQYLIRAVTHDDPGALILDFFAGSGTTAHAVAIQNSSDGGVRRSISVNLPEPVKAGSVADGMGYKHVSDVTEARLKLAMGLHSNFERQGLRVLRLNRSNFHDESSGDPNELFDLRESTLGDGEHVLEYIAQEVLLKEGVPLDSIWGRHEAAGAPVILADGVAVVMSLKLTQETANAALRLKPKVIVFLEDGFAGADTVKANTFTNAKNAGIVMKTV